MRFFHPSWAQGAGRRGEGRGMEDKEDRHTHTKNPLNPKRLQHGTDSVYCCDSSLISPVFLEQLLPPFELFAQIKKNYFQGKMLFPWAWVHLKCLLPSSPPCKKQD